MKYWPGRIFESAFAFVSPRAINQRRQNLHPTQITAFFDQSTAFLYPFIFIKLVVLWAAYQEKRLRSPLRLRLNGRSSAPVIKPRNTTFGGSDLRTTFNDDLDPAPSTSILPHDCSRQSTSVPSSVAFIMGYY
ncbi:hypothetical protein LMH87_011202 [Akanthomyces muscarius]|uniref:Uncharacterized protein n=1 Tax=Akanthomyces muscarius TaxID=2231603 RepID=A0A9W8QAU3_AKAMU|nr:hypothetical protein LMH87_011202 [Akanthomyces muscarius]KAJ4150452.1 hypothetical protein LMH87_011202 [Akanthomyces muscarius]